MERNQNISPEELEVIERYLQNSMSAGEAAAFEAEMQQDKQLQDKVSEMRLILLGINEVVLSERLNRYHNEFKPAAQVQQTRWILTWKWSLAASVIFIVALTTWWISHSANRDERMYSSYYKPDPGLMTLMSSGNSNYDFEKAMVEYKNGEYAKANHAWSQMLKEKPDNDTLLYFIGVAAQASGDIDAAIRYLQTIADNRQSSFQKDACWYLGLALIKKGAKDKVSLYIEKSGNSQSYQLLKELNE